MVANIQVTLLYPSGLFPRGGQQAAPVHRLAMKGTITILAVYLGLDIPLYTRVLCC